MAYDIKVSLSVLYIALRIMEDFGSCVGVTLRVTVV